MTAPAPIERPLRGRGRPAEPPAAQANRNGVRFFHLGQLAEARERFHRATELDPGNAEYRNNYGWALYQLGDLEAARRELERAVELDPERAVAYASLADVRTAQGDTAAAIALYERFLQLNEDPRHQRTAEGKLRELRGSP